MFKKVLKGLFSLEVLHLLSENANDALNESVCVRVDLLSITA